MRDDEPLMTELAEHIGWTRANDLLTYARDHLPHEDDEWESETSVFIVFSENFVRQGPTGNVSLVRWSGELVDAWATYPEIK